MGEQKENYLHDLSGEIIETERLLLVPVSMEYLPQMVAELTDEITKLMSIYPPKSPDETANYIKESQEKLKKGNSLQLVILDKNTKEFLGGAGIKNLDTRTPEPGI